MITSLLPRLQEILTSQIVFFDAQLKNFFKRILWKNHVSFFRKSIIYILTILSIPKDVTSCCTLAKEL